ncbi:hypothetical protein BH11PSE12_BH11PSE12_32750 [soil metagenome]
MSSYRHQSGITYLAVLVLVALMGAVLAATGIIWKTTQQREKERELLFVGAQFRTAILLYYEKSAGRGKQYPKTLDDLLQDNRSPVMQRHLRKIYIDPMTRKNAWGLVPGPNGGIMGVYSLSEDEPIKSGNFSLVNNAFEDKAKYSEWQFVYLANQANQQSAPTNPATPPTAAVPPSAPTAAPAALPIK